ncbi:MAG: response regulator, partial [SAR324 cluster bacterium]|nr:response regulator [SAR324 cluster bacterium]
MDLLKTIRETLSKDVKIIIVDDEKNILSSLNREMRNQGFSIETFSDSDAALKRLDQTEFALIISDNVMPKRSG